MVNSQKVVRISYWPWLEISMICPFNTKATAWSTVQVAASQVCVRLITLSKLRSDKPEKLLNQFICVLNTAYQDNQVCERQCPIISSLLSFYSDPLYQLLDSITYHVPGSLSTVLGRGGVYFCPSLAWKWRATYLRKWRMFEETQSTAWTGENELSLWFCQVGNKFCMEINNTWFINCYKHLKSFRCMLLCCI